MSGPSNPASGNETTSNPHNVFTFPPPTQNPQSQPHPHPQPQRPPDPPVTINPGPALYTVLSDCNIFSSILYYLYTPPFDYGVISHLVPCTGSSESKVYYETISLKGVCKAWRQIMAISPATPFQNPLLSTTIEKCHLHIPFLAWLASKMRIEMLETYCGMTNFPNLRNLAENAGFMADNVFISHPAIDKILVTITADYHRSFTRGDLGPSFRYCKYTFRANQRFSEDVFLIRNEGGVRVQQVYRVIMDALNAYYNMKKAYMVWMIEVGFVEPNVDVVGRKDDDMTERLGLTLFEHSKRSVRIYPTDHRLDVRNEHCKPRPILSDDEDDGEEATEDDDEEEDGDYEEGTDEEMKEGNKEDNGDTEEEKNGDTEVEENGNEEEEDDGTDKMGVDEGSSSSSEPITARPRKRYKRSHVISTEDEMMELS
ncbi:hypothetical protein AA313_de0204592 [Arthrobotrys entomopaga]|nr:hypothetical protein AA313_de0204592 [Arthrobotrys entomopaga]